jgi:hypothetical protein
VQTRDVNLGIPEAVLQLKNVATGGLPERTDKSHYR